MPPFIVEHVGKLWDTWNIRGLIILSLLLQSFLNLSAQLRKQRGGKWIIMIPLWIAYLLADWVATFTIGLMLRAERSDILAFWAPFLLLHLGGPDTITSFSLEDNEFWIRHLLGLILQVGSTIYVILQSLPHNKLWLPAFLVLIAGIIKYAERNRAFYLASFDHFGNNWASIGTGPPMPVQINRIQPKNALLVKYTFGAVKSLLVGPPLANIQKLTLLNFMRQEDSHVILQTIEIQLSLLYELLYSELPVVDSKIGYVCRIVNFGCILGALVSFPILHNRYYHNKFVEFDIWLTYGLLIGALALDLISILLLISSDWIILAHARKVDFHEFFNRCRWSNSIPQLNILACHFKSKDDYSNKLVDFLGINSFFESIRRLIQCVSFKDLVEDEAWNFIFTTLKEKHVAGRGMFYPGILHGDTHDTNFNWSIDKFEYLESLLMWHIATEICYRIGGPDKSPSTSTSTSRSFGHREICKLISDYMFYLLVMEPTTIAVSPNSLKMVFEGEKLDTTWRWPHDLRGEKGSKETFNKEKALDNLLVDQKGDVRNLLDKIKIDVDKLSYEQMLQTNQISRVTAACYLAKELLNRPGGCPWELMGRFWVEIVGYAANNCQPIVHARQVSKGGQFLTLVWLLINYLGLTPSLSEWSEALERKVLTDQKKELQEPTPADQKKKEAEGTSSRVGDHLNHFMKAFVKFNSGVLFLCLSFILTLCFGNLLLIY